MSSILGLDVRSAVPGGVERLTDPRRPKGLTIARSTPSMKPRSDGMGGSALPSSGDIFPAQRRQDAGSPPMRGEEEERDEGMTAEEEALLQLLLKKRSAEKKTAVDAEQAYLEATTIRSKPVAKRSHAAWFVGPKPPPLAPVYDNAPFVAVSALEMGSVVPAMFMPRDDLFTIVSESEASGSEFSVKVSPGTRAEYFVLRCGEVQTFLLYLLPSDNHQRCPL